MKTMGYAALNATTPLVPFSFERRALRRNDVAIEILWSGVCHSDLHQTRDDWKEWGGDRLSLRSRARNYWPGK
ncbi:alcohol dehydrogenase [Raoultella ornithinolytica]|nr:alcohol dehydrogenase [Raoultella ornithinolytica]